MGIVNCRRLQQKRLTANRLRPLNAGLTDFGKYGAEDCGEFLDANGQQRLLGVLQPLA